MAGNDTSIIIIDDYETQPNAGEVIELSPEPPAISATVPIKPTFEVVFRDQNEYDKLSDAVLKAFKQSEQLGEPKFEYVAKDGHIEAFGLETLGVEEGEQSDTNSIDSIDFGDDLNKLFTIDATPSETLEFSEVPSYKRHSRDVLDIERKPKLVKIDDNACPRPRPATACFNCGKFEHSVRDCPKPRNPERIARAKRTHASKGERYHVEVDQKFSHIQPGQISDKLRKALGLRKHELPSFFYRMRTLGYPPGWMEEAKVSHSGLAMFNTNDDVLKAEESRSESMKYDISKIIEFPGFNTMPNDCRDEYKFYNVPPYNEAFSKERMIAAFGDAAIKGFKRKKPKEETDNTSPPTEKAIEMEIDDDIKEENVNFARPMPPPMPPAEENELPPPLPPLQINDAGDDDDETEEGEIISCSKSPSLEELEAQQRQLIEKLTNGVDESLNDSNVPTAETPKTPTTPITPVTSLTASTATSSQYIIKTSHIGTPVLKFQPFDKIPSTDNFKVGVSDVINFENLPDSTGKYENMKEIISKVRIAKKKLAQDDD